jgi:transcriptional regulator with XRE-family HTH domain
MTESESLGERIRRLRHERGMSLAKVAQGDFSRAFVNQVEKGRANPSIRVLKVIAERLGTQAQYLIDGTSPVLDREIALERSRLALLRGELGTALAELEPVNDSEWPLGADAALCRAQALIGLDREAEADELLEAQRAAIEEHGDFIRLRRLRALLTRHPFRFGGRNPGAAYTKLGDESLAAGDSAAALEHYRTARTLLELTPTRQPGKNTKTGAAPAPRE